MLRASFDPARECELYFRCNRAGSKDIVVTYSDGTPYSFIYEEFAANIFRYEGEKKIYVSLLISYNANRMTLSITKALSNINEGEYYFELYNAQTEQTWIATMCHFHNGRFDGVNNDTTSLTVNTQGEVLSITLEVPVDMSLRILTQTTTSTLTPSPSYDCFEITEQAEALTIANPSTDYGNFEIFTVRIKDNGTARALTFGNKYRAQGSALPTTTTISKSMNLVFMYDSTADKYDVKWSEEV